MTFGMTGPLKYTDLGLSIKSKHLYTFFNVRLLGVPCNLLKTLQKPGKNCRVFSLRMIQLWKNLRFFEDPIISHSDRLTPTKEHQLAGTEHFFYGQKKTDMETKSKNSESCPSFFSWEQNLTTIDSNKYGSFNSIVSRPVDLVCGAGISQSMAPGGFLRFGLFCKTPLKIWKRPQKGKFLFY